MLNLTDVIQSCSNTLTRGGTHHEIWFSPEGLPEDGARGQFRGQKPYFMVCPDSSQRIDIIPL